MNATTVSLLAATHLVMAAPCAFGQMDLLLPVKRTPPNVIIALDLSSRMQRDALDVYLDPHVFTRSGEPFEAAIGVDGSNTARAYRRRYTALAWEPPGAPVAGTCRRLEILGDLAPGFGGADGRTRLGRVRAALVRAIDGNGQSARFGLVTSRQSATAIDPASTAIGVTEAPGAQAPTDSGLPGRWRSGIPHPSGPGAAAPAALPLVFPDSPGANADLRRLLSGRPGTPGALLPAGADAAGAVDAPLGLLIDDVRVEATRLIDGDAICRNTVVVLVAAGGDPSLGATALADRASALLQLRSRRVPVYVVAIAPSPGDVAQLREVAVRTGGQYFEVGPEVVERVPDLEPVPEIVAALHSAVQHGCAGFADFNTRPTADRPYGPPSYFPTGGPVVGTVNLQDALDAAGSALPATRVLGRRGEVLPQPSNVMFTVGFELPGFFGRLSAYRVYRPIPDESRLTGYRFASDGARLWTARAPSAEQRNVYTVVPGAGIVPFRSSNASLLAPLLGAADAAALIDAIRALPIGPSLNSTPALLEPPSDLVADPAYQAFVDEHRNRRGLVFIGADDGMMHAFDARTGVEVWAVIPFNLLPRLRRLAEGRPLDTFPYFVEGSPRLADVKIGASWRSYLLFGEGPGGTFYQAFDVTLDGISAAVPPDTDSLPALLAWFANSRRIPFAWSYPRLEQFDPALPPEGDLAASSSDAEKSVGQAWSTPAVGRTGGPTGLFVAIVGSGPMPYSTEQSPRRGGTRAGTRMYMLDAATGVLVDNRDVGSDGTAEDQDGCTPAVCAGLKNAIQADPLAERAADGAIVRAYVGDLDGRLWRFDVSPAPQAGFTGAPSLLFSAGADQPIFGSVARLAGSTGQSYLFFGTGSEYLPVGRQAAGYRVVGLAESTAGMTLGFDRVLRTMAAGGVGEGLAGAPVVAGSVVFFATTAHGGGCDPPEASLYALDVGGGVAYDADGDGRRDAADTPVVSRLRQGKAGMPVVADRHLFVAIGDRIQVYGDPQGFASGPSPTGLRILSWREVRDR